MASAIGYCSSIAMMKRVVYMILLLIIMIVFHMSNIIVEGQAPPIPPIPPIPPMPPMEKCVVDCGENEARCVMGCAYPPSLDPAMCLQHCSDDNFKCLKSCTPLGNMDDIISPTPN
ncbi:hypothetical protein Scep_020827 [Stephania cephalantha]|uniref:Uncharacterized protein n=1 Tax=Stephania cephalantha TaxID=152367 RepID=A0AAP0F7E4_9MAGN